MVAWRDLCGRLEALGERLLGESFPGGEFDNAEGFAHLAEQVVCWFGWSIGHSDPLAPAFQRQNDLITKWGGPNADNVYRHARLDPTHRYLIRGRMNSCEDFILAVRAGFMHMERWGTLVEVTASDIGIGRDVDFEILLGGDGTDASVIPLPEGAAMVSIREYYFDWQAREPATFTIECLDADARPARRSARSVAAQLDEAIAGVEQSVTYWNSYMRDARARQTDNTFGPPVEVGKGLGAARYAFCFYALGPDDALVVDSDVPDARYWSLQLYSLGWFGPLDFAGRVTAINREQAWVATDGRLRVVVAQRDPGVANWLDTEDRPEGLLLSRWFWPVGTPSPSARVVDLSEIRSELPPDTPAVTPSQRQEEIARRRAHVAWRFRT